MYHQRPCYIFKIVKISVFKNVYLSDASTRPIFQNVNLKKLLVCVCFWKCDVRFRDGKNNVFLQIISPF